VPRLDRSIVYGGAEAAHLREADAARKARAGWRAVAIADGLVLPFVVVVFAGLTMLFGASAPIVVVALFVLSLIAAFLVLAWSRAAAAGQRIAAAIDAAWLAAAIDIARQAHGLTAASLASTLGIAEPQAEELMALVDVNASLPPTGMRVDDRDAAAEDEAAVGERAESEARAGGARARVDGPVRDS
jgi:hypothetical protein